MVVFAVLALKDISYLRILHSLPGALELRSVPPSFDTAIKSNRQWVWEHRARLTSLLT